MAHFEKELDRREIYRGKIFTVTSHRVETEGGAETARDVVNHHGGACVAAVPFDRAVEMVLSGEIIDAKTQTGLLMLALRRREEQESKGKEPEKP